MEFAKKREDLLIAHPCVTSKYTSDTALPTQAQSIMYKDAFQSRRPDMMPS
jgi:hypothetical protein